MQVINFRAITEENDVYPFAIYHEDVPVGFMMLDEDLEERTITIWRIMFPPEHQGKGYGTEALTKIIELMRKSGFPNRIKLSTEMKYKCACILPSSHAS